VGFVTSALLCPMVDIGILLVVVLVLSYKLFQLSKRVSSIEQTASVRDFLKNAKKKK